MYSWLPPSGAQLHGREYVGIIAQFPSSLFHASVTSLLPYLMLDLVGLAISMVSDKKWVVLE